LNSPVFNIANSWKSGWHDRPKQRSGIGLAPAAIGPDRRFYERALVESRQQVPDVALYGALRVSHVAGTRLRRARNQDTRASDRLAGIQAQLGFNGNPA